VSPASGVVGNTPQAYTEAPSVETDLKKHQSESWKWTRIESVFDFV